MDEKSNEFKKFFSDDLAHLLHLYNQKNTFRYDEFVKVWNEFKFYQLLSLFFYYPIFYRDFIKDALKVTSEYLCDELDLEVRTGALYTLYGIYFHQVDKPKMKIQVTQNQWLEILKFIGEITQNEENADIDYIFRFLLHSDAFEFCATATDIKGVTNQYMVLKPRQNKKDLENKINVHEIMKEFKDDLFRDPFISELSTIHETYIQMKNDCIDDDKNLPIRALHVITEDFNELMGLGNDNGDAEDQDSNIEDENNQNQDEEELKEKKAADDSVLSRRMRVRQKASQMSKKMEDE